jgi:hypothetical protein
MNDPNTTRTETRDLTGDESLWGFASGRVSVLETQLLNRSYFESLARSRSIGEAQSLLGKTPYRAYFTTGESIANYSLTLDQAFTKIVESVLKDAPPHAMNTYFKLADRYLYFRNLFIHFSSRNATIPDMESTFGYLAENEVEMQAISRHRDMVSSHEAPGQNQPVARSLFLDSALTALKLKIASLVVEEKIATVLRDMALLESWTAILRSRWNGTDPEIVQKWFMLPDEYGVFIKNTAHFALANPVASLRGVISDGVLNRLEGVNLETLRQSLDIIVREVVRDEVLVCRMVPFGAERVFSYYVSLSIEVENLRLALATVVSGLESRVVIDRFRREYA